VTVGAGDGSDVGESDGDGDGDGDTVNGESEVCRNVTAPPADPNLTLKVTDDVPDKSADEAESEVGSIHYRPQLKTTARARITSVGTPRTATTRAGAASGAFTDKSEEEDIRSVPAFVTSDVVQGLGPGLVIRA
jgi:hypothetical protein